MKDLPFLKLWRVLDPFHQLFKQFLLLIVLYELLQIADSYALSVVIRLFESSGKWIYYAVFLLILVVYDELFMRLDNHLDWHILAKQAYPIFKFLHKNALSKFLDLDLLWHQSRNSGALVGKVNKGVDKTSDLMSDMQWEFVPTLVQVILTLPVLIWFSWPIALIALFSFPMFMHWSIQARKARKPVRKVRHDLEESIWHESVQTIQGIETVYSFNQECRVLDHYDGILDNIIKYGQEEAYIGIYTYNRKRIRLLSFSRRLVLGILIIQLSTGAITIASLVFVNTLMEKLFHSFWRFSRLYDRADEASEAVDRLVRLYNEQKVIQNNPRFSLNGDKSKANICLVNVSFSYEGDPTNGVIHDVNFNVEEGQIVALVGPSGAGKSTIIRLFSRLYEPTKGNVYVGDRNISDWNIEDLRAQFSFVPQGDKVAIFDDTIGNNIRFSNKAAIEEQIHYAAKMAGIYDFVASLPEKFETQVGERGVKLSGGQKQRVALARAILADRPILVLDEATSAVDAITEHEIQKYMKEILIGKTAIIIAHRLSTIWDMADRIVVMDQGRIVEEGTHNELMNLKGLYAHMVELQQHS